MISFCIIFYCFAIFNKLSNKVFCLKFSLITTSLHLLKMWWEKFFGYTKTFGGKIWTNLHRVSTNNIFGKNFNKVFLKISRQNKIRHISCKKNCRIKANWTSLGKKVKKVWATPVSFLQIEILIWHVHLLSYFNSLHEMICGSFKRKSIMANYRASDQKY